MSNNKIIMPPYVNYYGMARDPFGKKIELDLFYAEPSRKQRLGSLQHLTQFGNELMIVTGPKGSGKSTLLHQFIAESPDLWKFSRIEAKQGLDERKILQQMYRQMGMEFKGATHNDLLEQMKTQFEILQRKGVYCVMLINDADQLPVTAIKKVMEMASLISSVNKPLLRIILFGTEGILKKLKDPLLSEYSDLQQRSMNLEPFSEDQTAQYVMGRLSAAHFVSTELFTPSVLHKLYTESYGWPARINELASNILMNSLPKDKQTSSTGFDIKTFKASRMVGLALTVSFVAAFIIFQDNIYTWASQYTDTISNGSSAKSAPPPAKKNATPVKSTSATKPATTLVEKLKQRNSNYRPEPKTTTTLKPVTSKPKTIITKNTKTVTNNTPKLTFKISAVARKEGWIFQQNTRHYTLQIVAGENLKTIEEFIDEHKLYNNIAFYRSVRKNKPWYGLIYGIYTNKEAAASDINQLPKNLQRLKPWVRSINSVQSDINKTRPQ